MSQFDEGEKKMENKIKKIKGALVGCAIGDAMGMPTEFMPREMIEKNFPNGIREFYESNRSDIVLRQMKAGEVTDDTINTIFIAEMLIDNEGSIDTQGYIDRIRTWIKECPEKSRYVNGPSTKNALADLERGVPLERSGIRGTTNGASMKIAPIGLTCDYKDMEALVKRVEIICLPTHNTSTAIAGASAVAACVSYAMQGGQDVSMLWELSFQAVRVSEACGAPYPGVSLERRMNAVRELVENQPQEEVLDQLKYFYGTGVETVESVPAVLAVITLAQGDPLTAISIAAELGADTDTIAAICGAICGCMHPDFPEEMICQLEEINQLDFENLAQRLEPYVVENEV